VTEARKTKYHSRRQGVVLLIALIVLVVLAGLGYTLMTRIAAQIHRDQYIIDYQNARYACDSALKYALTSLDGMAAKPISRPNEPDFSDVFAFTDEQYKQFLADWVATHPPEDIYDQYEQNADVNDVNFIQDSNTMNLEQLFGDMNDANMSALFEQSGNMNDSNVAEWYRDPNKLVVPGPYGPPWPLIKEPVELEIGNAKVTIEIEDENAKLPLVWGTNTDKDKQREVDAAMTTFCEWMNMSAEQRDNLTRDLKDIGQVKSYTAGTPIAALPDVNSKSSTAPNAARQGLSRRSRRRTAPTAPEQPKPAAKGAQADVQINDFARLFHSSMIDTEQLAQPYIKTEQRTESVLKYISRWGATQVNVNSAPRQVLEAAFMFGGDAPEVAEAIIKARHEKPFSDANDLQKRIYKYADSLRKSKDFITTASNVFTVKITAVSGVAQSSTTAAILMEGKEPRIIAIIAE
jgi:Tfp pilus assembly protein PilX